MIDTNVKGLVAMTHALLPDMVARSSGTIHQYRVHREFDSLSGR